MLHMLDARAKAVGLKNIKPLLGNRVDPALPPAQLDLVLLVDVYHELSNPEEMLHAIRASLKPEGRLVLAEFRLEDPEVPIKLLHKMSKEQILKEIVPAGFRLVEQFDDLPWQHLMFFQPDPAAERRAIAAEPRQRARSGHRRIGPMLAQFRPVPGLLRFSAIFRRVGSCGRQRLVCLPHLPLGRRTAKIGDFFPVFCRPSGVIGSSDRFLVRVCVRKLQAAERHA